MKYKFPFRDKRFDILFMNCNLSFLFKLYDPFMLQHETIFENCIEKNSFLIIKCDNF